MKPLSHMGSWPRTALMRSGAKFFVQSNNSSDFAILNEVAIDDVYGIENLIAPKRILDVGANTGVFSILAAKKFPNATVIAIEPERANLLKLKRNIEQSGVSNITVVNKAVAAKRGSVSLHIDQSNPGAHSLFGKGEAQTIEAITLDEFLPADVLKLDAEGIEYEIFRDTVPDIPRIVMETHQGNDEALFARLSPKYQISSQGSVHTLIHRK